MSQAEEDARVEIIDGKAHTTPTWVRDALAGARSPRALRAARALTVGLAAIEVGRKAYTWAQERVLYTVAVPSSDDVYDMLHEWLVEQVPPRRRRAVLGETAPRVPANMHTIETPGSPRPEPARLRLSYDGSRVQIIRVGRHRVHVKVERDARVEGLNLTVRNDDWFRPLTRIVFTAYGEAARDAVLALLADLAAERAAGKNQPRLWLANRWGGWRRLNDAPPRPLSTVILPAGQLESIVDDLDAFLAAEELYSRVGLPWHRGYLFHGPPGTGKTSLARALAERFGLDVYYLPLSDLEADANLLQMLGEVDARAMLVLEDIDVVRAARSRDGESKAVTMSGLLNALDGFVTPHGLVTVMTTNDLAALDPALVRPGRADQLVEFRPLDDDQAARLAELVAGAPVVLPPLQGPLTHAELLEAAKPHLGDGDTCAAAIAARITAGNFC